MLLEWHVVELVRCVLGAGGLVDLLVVVRLELVLLRRIIWRLLLLHVRVLVGSWQARVEHLDVILDRVGREVLARTSGVR